MPQICPSILSATEADYKIQAEAVAGFAHRIQIDLTDGVFADGANLNPETIWWPVGIKADIHLMHQKPLDSARAVLKHRPNMLIAHVESDVHFEELKTVVKSYGVLLGIALLPKSPVDLIEPILDQIDHVLIFSGNLGRFGGTADLSQLDKVSQIKSIRSDIEVGWDGGINDQNIAELAMGGVDVLNVGGFIQRAENPHNAYAILERIAEEAGTT